MKNFNNIRFSIFHRWGILILLFTITMSNLNAQDETSTTEVVKPKPVKNTFGSTWVMNNQTVMVPIKGTLQFDIQHCFGTTNNGSKDLFGLFAPSNIRLGLGYTLINNLTLGLGITKERMQMDLNAKYSILKQTAGSMPISLTYFGNIVIDTRAASNFRYTAHRFSYFNQLLIARKITNNFSAQVAPSFSWFNNIEGYVDSKGDIQKKMNNGHLAVSLLGRYKISANSAILVGYDQPITSHPTNNPHPNICFGIETTTSAHAFQVFVGNYYGIVPQSNNMFNKNDYREGNFLIGFNITRLWNY